MKNRNHSRARQALIIIGALILAAATVAWAQDATGQCYKTKNCQGPAINKKCTFEQCKAGGGRSWYSDGDCFEDISGGYDDKHGTVKK